MKYLLVMPDFGANAQFGLIFIVAVLLIAGIAVWRAWPR